VDLLAATGPSLADDHRAINTQLRAAMEKVESSGSSAPVEALMNALFMSTQVRVGVGVCVCARVHACECVHVCVRVGKIERVRAAVWGVLLPASTCLRVRMEGGGLQCALGMHALTHTMLLTPP